MMKNKKIIKYTIVIVLGILLISVGVVIAKTITVVSPQEGVSLLGTMSIGTNDPGSAALNVDTTGEEKKVAINTEGGKIVMDYVPNNDNDLVNVAYLESVGLIGGISAGKITPGTFGSTSSNPGGDYTFSGNVYVGWESDICSEQPNFLVAGQIETDGIITLSNCVDNMHIIVNNYGGLDFISNNAGDFNFDGKVNSKSGFQYHGIDGLSHSYTSDEVLSGMNILGRIVTGANAITGINGTKTILDSSGAHNCQMNFVHGILTGTNGCN